MKDDITTASDKSTGTDAQPLEKRWSFDAWSSAHYVFLPAGAYNGNRFFSLKLPYSPRVPEEFLKGPDTPMVITDVPRLALPPEPSFLQLKTGDLAFPCFGWFDPAQKSAWLAWAEHPEEATDWMWEVTESHGHASASFRIQSPGIRQSPVYRFPMMQRTSPDPLAEARRTRIDVNVDTWSCETIGEFLDRIFSMRAGLAENVEVPPVMPMSAAFDLIEEHYHRDSWIERIGQFATNCDPASSYPYQTGWCGGMIATHGLLASKISLTRTRVLRSLETFFTHAPRACGLFAGRCSRDGVWSADLTHDLERPYTHNWTLTRRQGDTLYFLLRQLRALESEGPWKAPQSWNAALLASAECFIKIWEKHGQFGQFLNQDSGEILLGGSASGAIIPGALALASIRFGDTRFLEVATQAGEYFAREFLVKGFTTGGPGDACQNPDSESAAALVESCALLHQATGESIWLRHGTSAAALLATWVMPYNFRFPTGSEFSRLDVRTRGSVFANTQNKHSAPGLCTQSGRGLLDLFRATGDTRLIDLLCEIARFIPQTVSRVDRPIHTADGRPLPSGWINERVNTSDWDENVGGVFFGSCWCEVSLLLTHAELPGIYCRPDLDKVWVLDHMEVQMHQEYLEIRNPTAFPARVRVLIESAQSSGEIQEIGLQPGSFVMLPISEPWADR